MISISHWGMFEGDENEPDFRAMAECWVNWARSNQRQEQARLLYRAGYLSVAERERIEIEHLPVEACLTNLRSAFKRAISSLQGIHS